MSTRRNGEPGRGNTSWPPQRNKAPVNPMVQAAKFPTRAPPRLDAGIFIVSFKNSRAEAFRLVQDTNYIPRLGDLVRVEAEMHKGWKGWDVGIIQATGLEYEQANTCLDQYRAKHRAELTAQLTAQFPAAAAKHTKYGIAGSDGVAPPGASCGSSVLPILRHASLDVRKMTCIQGPATAFEIATLGRKDRIAGEIRAQKLCQDLADQLHLKIDGNRLTFSYHSKDYIQYKYLVASIWKFYPMRILMSSFEPLNSSSLGMPYGSHNILAKLNDTVPLYHISSASADCSNSLADSDASSSRSSSSHGPLGANTWAEQNMGERRLAVALSKNSRHTPRSPVNYGYYGLSLALLEPRAMSGTSLTSHTDRGDRTDSPEPRVKDPTDTEHTMENISPVRNFQATKQPVLRRDNNTGPGTGSFASKKHLRDQPFELWRRL
ncbi:hypothetical protein LTR56_025757 [Elasticomyces elasticus]|nr:hypothetical protein LTR56_025757 [Elasticomyces elasticus]KAK4904779.1 hypothetical protein LTR49_025829 [Elasticomyces elasticus]KAK5739353.1 hypothetical protein LTS12_025305 [Elasticomyces elasticus]